MKKAIRVVLFVILALFLLTAVILTVLFFNEARSLASVKKLDDYGMYSMTVYGDYGFDGFLETGAETTDDIAAYVKKTLLKGLPVDIAVEGASCSTFVARNEKGEVLFGRNFDYYYAPSAVVFTDSKTGYASISVSDLAFSGYNSGNLPQGDGISRESLIMLSAPYITEDGMNEKGVAMSIMTTPTADAPHIEGAPTLNTLTMVRMVLDKAASVDAAVELMRGYNINWYGTRCHFFIADSSGKSVVVEYYDDELHAIENPYVTNFDLHEPAHGGSGFERYDRMEETINANGGVLTREQALTLLKEVAVPGRIQWSALYNLTTGEVSVFPAGKIEAVHDFKLEMTK